MPGITLPSVQSLLLQATFKGQPLATGTGFVVQTTRGPHLITNRHNVTGRRQDNNQPLSLTGGVPDQLVILQNFKGRLGYWESRVEDLYVGGAPRWVEHLRLAAKADFVALPLQSLHDVELYPYDLSVGSPIRVGPADTVSVVGFPFGMQAGGSLAVWATGFVASEPDIDYGDLPVFLIDCRSRPGQSGSAVIAYRSGGAVAMEDGSTGIFTGPVTKLLGVYSGRINEQSDLGIVWKASAIRELVDSLK